MNLAKLKSDGCPAVLRLGLAVALGALSGCGPEASKPVREPAAASQAGAKVPEIPEVTAGALDPALKEALDSARAAVLKEPSYPEAWGHFGQALDAAEFASEARECYREASRLSPSSARWLHLLGLLELHGEEERALEHLAKAVALDGGTNDAPRLRLAQALIERGRNEEARGHLRTLTNAQPAHPAARLELARLELSENRPDAAAVLLEACVTNQFTARPAVLLLSQARARQGRAAEAETLARRAASMPRPYDWPDPYLREVQALRADRARQAEKANALLAQRKFGEADTVIDELLRRFPGDPEFLLLSGRARLLQRKCPEAEQQFREHLKVADGSLNGLIQLSLALLCQQRWKDAESVLEQAVAVKPDFAQAHANLGLARSRQGNAAGAIASYREALRSSPGDAAAHASLAEELLRSGVRIDAELEATRALQIDPGNTRARAVLERIGRP